MTKPLATSFVIFALALGTQAAAAKQTNRQVMDRFFAVIDSKQFDRLPEVEVADLVMTTPMGPVKGTEGHKQMLKGYSTAFPNFKHIDLHCVEAGDEIACDGKIVGDHTGPLMTPDGKAIPATNKHLELPYAGLAKIKGGKVVQLRIYYDMMSFMAQLGLLPPPPKTASR